jgi:CRISPR-associated protein Cas1
MAGSESFVEFLQEFSKYQTKESLVYDLQEPFRWIADVTVMEAFESGVLDLPDFYFTGDDYRYRFEPEAKQRFLDLLRDRFNAGVGYKSRVLKWDTVIEQKAIELGTYLVGSTSKLDFCQPAPTLKRTDSLHLQRQILSLSGSKAVERGISRNTLHYLRKRAETRPSFKVYSKVLRRLNKELPARRA